jgi:prolyl-tRNA synthetase
VTLLDSTKPLGISVKKTEDFSEWYLQAVIKTEMVDYGPVKGFIVLRPYGYKIWNILSDSLNKRLIAMGHENGFLPLLIPENILAKEKQHFSGFNPEVFWVTAAGNNLLSERLALRPTSEAVAYSTFSNWIKSYRDLPLKMNFWNSALRADIKGTKPLIRNSEFLWQEGHTVHESEEEAKSQSREILEVYREVIEDNLAIPCIGGHKSEKEKFVGADDTLTLESIMSDGKALQMATSHNLGQNFSKTFGIKYLGRDNREHFAWQTSWGLSWRLIGAVIMVHGDDRGIILPPRIAPIQIVIVPIFRDEDAIYIKRAAAEIGHILEGAGLRILVDDRDEYTSGWKFNEWELKGVPLRVNIGKRDIEKGELELVRRDTLHRIYVKRGELSSRVPDLLERIQANLLAKARGVLDQSISEAKSLNALKSAIENKGGFVFCGWCENQECELRIKEATGADLRVIPFVGQDLSRFASCVYCENKASCVVAYAQSY